MGKTIELRNPIEIEPDEASSFCRLGWWASKCELELDELTKAYHSVLGETEIRLTELRYLRLKAHMADIAIDGLVRSIDRILSAAGEE